MQDSLFTRPIKHIQITKSRVRFLFVEIFIVRIKTRGWLYYHSPRPATCGRVYRAPVLLRSSLFSSRHRARNSGDGGTPFAHAEPHQQVRLGRRLSSSIAFGNSLSIVASGSSVCTLENFPTMIHTHELSYEHVSGDSNAPSIFSK